jgi:ankyrin repeat protein
MTRMTLFTLPDEIQLNIFSYLQDDGKLQQWYVAFKKVCELMHTFPRVFFSEQYLSSHRYPEEIYINSMLPLDNILYSKMTNMVITAGKHGYLALLQQLCAKMVRSHAIMVGIEDSKESAIAFDRAACVQYLITEKLVSRTDVIKKAAQYDSVKTMAMLLLHPAVDVFEYENREALEVAVEEGSMRIIHMLIADGRFEITEHVVLSAIDTGDGMIFDMVFRNRNNYSNTEKKHILIRIVRAKNTEIMHHLLTDGNISPDFGNNVALRTAVHEGHTEMVELLLGDVRVGLNIPWEDIFMRAVQRNHTKIVQLLLRDNRMSVTTQMYDTILCAAENSYPAILRMLLADMRFNVHNFTRSPLSLAVDNGNNAIVEILLADGRFDPSENESELLRESVFHDRVAIVKLLLKDRRSNPNAKSGDCIKTAMNYYNVRILHLLVEDTRVDITKHVKKKTPEWYDHMMMLAILEEDIGLVDVLLKYGQCTKEHIKWGSTTHNWELMDILYAKYEEPDTKQRKLTEFFTVAK